jgi:hypothetical protein
VAGDFDEVDEEAVEEPETDPAAHSAWEGLISQEVYVAGLVRTAELGQTTDRRSLEQAAAWVRDILRSTPTDNAQGDATHAFLISRLAVTLRTAERLEGSLQDADAALAVLRELRCAPGVRGLLRTKLTAMTLSAEISFARRREDLTALSASVEELEGLYALLPPHDEFRVVAGATLGHGHAELGFLTEKQTRLDSAARYYEEVLAEDPQRMPLAAAASFPTMRAFLLAELVVIKPGREALGRAVAATRQAVATAHCLVQEEVLLRYTLGQALLYASRHFDDADLLDLCITELRHVHTLMGGLAEGRQRKHHADAMGLLSMALWERVWRNPHAPSASRDLEASMTARHLALHLLTLDVLYQHGAEHGLSVARTGSEHALWLAYWNVHFGQNVQAVQALELGRALVLRATTASRGYLGRLEAAGRLDLAVRWQELLQDPLRPGAGTALLDPSPGPQLPGGLRHAAYRAISAGGQDAISEALQVASVPELTAGLATAGTDALVYLIPGQDHLVPRGNPAPVGQALILRPGSDEPTAVALPLLRLGSHPLLRYLDAAAERSRHVADPTADPQRQTAWEALWESALDGLCDWAWSAVMGPLLAALGPLDHLPRIVLVPCGPLGIIPWHAARTSDALGKDGRGGPRYACQEALISYAPSGGQFLHAAARERMSGGRHVLVNDPQLTLVWADIETEALHASYYPHALRYGGFSTGGEADTVPGTPEDLLAVLPGGPTPAAVMHIACHAVAGRSPTHSLLHLAAPPGVSRDAGHLTLARILDTATGPGDSGGSLIVLSACETDLSNRDHDEALTLATALVARGAADVVGSRWAVQGAPTALMMAVFHHYLTTDHQAPADALRAAQLWMLDPDREPPPTLHDPVLRGEATRADLDRVHYWAGFTHQGNPTVTANDGNRRTGTGFAAT